MAVKTRLLASLLILIQDSQQMIALALCALSRKRLTLSVVKSLQIASKASRRRNVATTVPGFGGLTRKTVPIISPPILAQRTRRSLPLVTELTRR